MDTGYWQNKVVCVTGGSAGLGREIVAEFAESNAIVIAVARDEERLQQACATFNEAGLSVSGMQADVTDEVAFREVLQRIEREHSQLDCLVNNVGISTRAKVDDCEVSEYRRLMEINFFAAVQCSQLAIPYLTASKGHLVNISSLAGKTPWPYLAPYTTSKHALTAFTQQLRIECDQAFHTLLVCPGPIQRDDANQRYNDEAKGLPEQARQAAGGAKVKGIPPRLLAKRIRIACQKRQRELVMPNKARILFGLSALNSKWGDWLLRKMMK